MIKGSKTAAEQPNNGEKKLDMHELVEHGKAKGSLSNSEIMEALEDVDYDIEQIEKLYETLENAGIEITGYLETPEFDEIENEVERYESAEDMEKMLAQEGLAIDESGAHVSEGNRQSCAARFRPRAYACAENG